MIAKELFNRSRLYSPAAYCESDHGTLRAILRCLRREWFIFPNPGWEKLGLAKMERVRSGLTLKKFIFTRMIESFFSLIGLVFLVFFLVRMTGNPADLYLPENATQEMRDRVHQAAWIKRPCHCPVRSICFAARPLRPGGFDASGPAGNRHCSRGLPDELEAGGVTMIIAVVLSSVIGVWAAFRPAGAFDRITTILSLGSASAPNFWVALTLISIFSVALRLLPTSGTGGFVYWIMPITVLVLRSHWRSRGCGSRSRNYRPGFSLYPDGPRKRGARDDRSCLFTHFGMQAFRLLRQPVPWRLDLSMGLSLWKPYLAGREWAS